MKCMPHEQERRKKKAHNSRHQTMPQFMKGTSMNGNFLNYKDLEFVGLPKAKVNIKGNIKENKKNLTMTFYYSTKRIVKQCSNDKRNKPWQLQLLQHELLLQQLKQPVLL